LGQSWLSDWGQGPAGPAGTSGGGRDTRSGLPDTHAPHRTASRPAAAAAAPPRPAGGFGAYDLLEMLGQGGMGVVYKARHRPLGRLVALKRILGGPPSHEDMARFKIEATAVARLHHPNIVQIYEVGEVDGHPYLALEFVEGGNLAQHVNGAPLPPPAAARLVEAVARAMEHAHRRRIVHRDLKPANILISADGTPKVTDFGLAKVLESGHAPQTQAGAVLGTAPYMAPEQVEAGEAVTAAADVYALGAILYELLTGRPPLVGASLLETLARVRSAPPVPPSQLQPSVPRDLETVCLKCLEKDPHRRYASAEALADNLYRFLRHEPVAARRPGLAGRLAAWSRRPERLRQVGPLALITTLVVMAWPVLGGLGLLLGLTPMDRPGAALRFAGLLVVGWLLPHLWFIRGAFRGEPAALWGGALTTLVLIAVTVAPPLGWLDAGIDFHRHDPTFTLALTLLMLTPLVIQQGCFVFALRAYYARPRPAVPDAGRRRAARGPWRFSRTTWA
jgi:hypothetical protein